MPKIEIKSKSGKTLALLLVLVVFLSGVVNGIGSFVSKARLLTQGQVTDGEVARAHTYALSVWLYRVEYRFTVDDIVYEEPVHNGYRMKDIGAWKNRFELE